MTGARRGPARRLAGWTIALGLAGAMAAACHKAERPALLPEAPGAGAARAARAREEVGSDPGFIGVVVAGEAVEVEPRAEARVEEIFVEPGDQVTRGTALCRLDVRTSEHELEAAQAALAEAAGRLGRRLTLARTKPGAVTREEIDSARRETLQEKARVAELSEARADATLRAPFDGAVVERYLATGALAGPGRPIVRLVGRGQPRVRFAVPEERAQAVGLGQPVEVRIAGAARPLTGRITGVSPEIDSASRMVYAAAAFDAAQAPAAALATGVIARVFLAGAAMPRNEAR